MKTDKALLLLMAAKIALDLIILAYACFLLAPLIMEPTMTVATYGDLARICCGFFMLNQFMGTRDK